MELDLELKGNDIILVILSKEKYASEMLNILKPLSMSRVCYICFNEPCASVVKKMSRNGIGSKNFFFIDTLTKSVHDLPDSEGCIYVSAPNDLTEISMAFTKAMGEKHCEVALLDTLSALLIYDDQHSIIQFVHGIVTKLRVSSGRAVFIALKEDISSELVKDLYMFVDKVIEN